MSLNTLLIAGFFFIIGAAVMGIIWYLQSVAGGNFSKGKPVEHSDPNLAEVARLMRDKNTQNLAVTINGHTFRAASELNPGQNRRLNFASNVLVKWLAEVPPARQTDEAQATAPTQPVSVQHDQDETEWIPAESAPTELKPGYTPPFLSEPEPEVKPVGTQFSDIVGGILKPPSASTPPAEFKSIAMQIDEILQEMIADTPFEERGITVNDAPDHGVMVTLDGNKYPGVKDVPDEEVRNLIRSAVAEWEKSSKFGSR